MAAPPPNDRKRVKVYELRSNDWFDRGTGFCTGNIVNKPQDEAKIHVQSEDDPSRMLLETRITKDDGYQKQQDTLIVWTEANGTDMALSFQEAEGCGAIWDFVSEIQLRLGGGPIDDGISDDTMDPMHGFVLPAPELGNLPDIEHVTRMASQSSASRDALAKMIVQADYIAKLVPLVELAEDLESLADLHRLCMIMKTLILLNDTAIIEYIVTDEMILGAVGALEYDPDFPNHKANHRQYLSDPTRFKEVVKIEDANVKKKIHYTYRLQYLKDVVLARILDDPTFSVLNSLIFFHQVDIVQHLQANLTFLKELFSLFPPHGTDSKRQKDAVSFIKDCCATAKSLQANVRSQMYQNFIQCGLFQVMEFALKHQDAGVRVAGTDILVALIDHDALLVRGNIFKSLNDKTKPLTDTLIELLLVETDLGVKAQMADAIKVLLDPSANNASVEALGRSNSDYLLKVRSAVPAVPQTESFIQNFYDDSAKKLFQPLKDLEGRESMTGLTIQEVALYSHLIEVLCFFIRCHSFRSKYFILSEGLAVRVAQLMSCPEKHLKLNALKYFRTCIGLHDEFHNRQMIQHRLFEPIMNILYETMPKDNLLNSACLELFEFIKRENIKPIVAHLAEHYRARFEEITYVDTFQQILQRHDQMVYAAQHPLVSTDVEQSFTSIESEEPGRHIINGGQRWQGIKGDDAQTEAYFDADDDEEHTAQVNNKQPIANGASPVKPLVDYPDDDDEDNTEDTNQPGEKTEDSSARSETPVPQQAPPPPKRRREEDDDDDDALAKLSSSTKRRNSVSSTNSGNGASSANENERPRSAAGAWGEESKRLRNKSSKSINGSSSSSSVGGKGGGKDGPNKISISLAVKKHEQSSTTTTAAAAAAKNGTGNGNAN
ncbi:DUF625-domain-containing protein [Aulographum hederae CBS 113979]|uniref:DUF625-domain-containing protein n=1 Tax=Aulographum hederae CBS 113979 TaxID=1176131 RepID=A0A6G1HCL1_9PEZI|nr:DUF625-domain-containing protein [Aulographum hederae CBS 113979]